MRSFTTLDLQYAHRFYGFKGDAERPGFQDGSCNGISRMQVSRNERNDDR